jgi:hypothetical protein
MWFGNIPTSIGDNRRKFHYNREITIFGLKALSLKPNPHVQPSALSHTKNKNLRTYLFLFFLLCGTPSRNSHLHPLWEEITLYILCCTWQLALLCCSPLSATLLWLSLCLYRRDFCHLYHNMQRLLQFLLGGSSPFP